MSPMNFITRTIERNRAKRSLNEYGCEISRFDISPYGVIEYAQWLHPLEQKKLITREMLDFFRQFVHPGDFVIDIGAHTGDTTVPLSICSGSEGLVLALEPNPHVYKILQRNSGLNKHLARIVPLNFAATDTDGRFSFHYSDASYCNGGFFDRIENRDHGHKHILEVDGKNLENFLNANYSGHLSRLSLIKVDAEGYDKEILKSIRSILTNFKPVVISECNKNLTPGERFELFGVLHSAGYLMRWVEGFDSMVVKPIEKEEDMLQWKHFDFVAIPE